MNHLDVNEMSVSEDRKEKIRKLQQHEANNHKVNKVCPEAFDKLSINWNGDVTLCCSDYDNFMIIGNILDMDLQQLFLSKAANTYREIIAEGNYAKIHCCRTCYELTPLHK